MNVNELAHQGGLPVLLHGPIGVQKAHDTRDDALNCGRAGLGWQLGELDANAEQDTLGAPTPTVGFVNDVEGPVDAAAARTTNANGCVLGGILPQGLGDELLHANLDLVGDDIAEELLFHSEAQVVEVKLPRVDQVGVALHLLNGFESQFQALAQVIALVFLELQLFIAIVDLIAIVEGTCGQKQR